MVMCAVVNCGHRSGRDKVRFFRFPTITSKVDFSKRNLVLERRKNWLAKINRADLNEEKKINNSRVCGLHFIQGEPSQLEDMQNPDWIPTLELGYPKKRTQNQDSQLERYERACRRAATVDDSTSEPSPPQIDFEAEIGGMSCQTDLSMAGLRSLEEEIITLKKEREKLKEQLSSYIISEETFKDDDRVLFYTGLSSFKLLMVVFTFISSAVSSNHLNVLSKFQEFILFLMRLRLNLTCQDLAYRFNISVSTVSRVFNKWLDVSYVRMKCTIGWPERESLQKTMPLAFKAVFGDRVAVIIDCFEVFTDRPSSLITRAATWSNYKHHNTCKFLIGITPQGVISFISPAWGGRVSDKYLTERSGLFDHLLPGDLILADRGFTISDSVGFHCAELVVPAFRKGKKELSPSDISNTRKLASLRIHVERVIGHVRCKYTILKGQLPVELLTKKAGEIEAPIDKIAVVCCAFVNLSKSLVLDLTECSLEH